MRLAAIILLGASISCLAPISSPGQSARKNTQTDDDRAALREKILAERGPDYLSKGTGNCQLGVDYQDLDVNNVRARLYNTGGLFWKGAGPMYNVPKSTMGNAIFAHGIWIGGMVNGELRMAASDYGPWEFWPGPLDEDGNPPEDCHQYDRMYKVSRQDILDYEATGATTDDLADWPYELDAPVIDGDGDTTNYNLYGGDRPEILGDQTVWWVMNDKGNVHEWSLAPPLGIEVQVTAFAFKSNNVNNNTTYYRYKLVNRSGERIEEAWFGIWTDADLGDATNDYVGSDSLRDLGYTWNGTDWDGGYDGYGDRPPAVGVAVIHGPTADHDGIDNDRDGEVDEADERLGMTTFIGPQKGWDEPYGAAETYAAMQGIWNDGRHLTFGGQGHDFSTIETQYEFSGSPPEFWSEENFDNKGTRNPPGDRRNFGATGPFSLDPDESTEIIYAIVWAQGRDRFDSVSMLRSAAALIQAFGGCDCYFLKFPDPPDVSATAFDGQIVLNWRNEPSSNNYLDRFEIHNAFLDSLDVVDKTYSFEGYDVLQYASEADQVGQIIATFDVPNGVTKVVDVTDATTNIPISDVTAFGSDSGVRHSMRIEGLDNYRDYYFGVSAYAYNPNATPLVWRGPVSRITVRPSRVDARNGGTRIADGAFDATFTRENGGVTHEGKGTGSVTVKVVDPSVLTGDTYRVRFYEQNASDDPEEPHLVTNYDVLRSDGSKVFDGRTAVSSFGGAAPQTEDVLTVDGLSFSINQPDPSPLGIDAPVTEGGSPAFVQVAGEDVCGPSVISHFGCAEVGGDYVYGSFDWTAEWIMYRQGGAGPEESIGAFSPHDFEIRVTEKGSYGYHPFSDGNGEIHRVPFEVWDIGVNPPFQVNDPADDVQLIPAILSDNGGTCAFNFGEVAEDPFGLGWPVTDRIYAYYPTADLYSDWETLARLLVNGHPDGCPTSPDTDPASNFIDFDRGRPLQRVVFMMDPESPNYRESMIPVGNVIRFFTTKPNIPGDVFTVNTSGYAVETNVTEVARDALEQIAIVPNPYKGASDYELTNLSDVARFTNLPEKATIRVFTLAGTLVRTLIKSGPETSLDWDLLTDNDLPMGSGMYLVHVEVPGVGSKVIKFGLVKKRIQLSLY